MYKNKQWIRERYKAMTGVEPTPEYFHELKNKLSWVIHAQNVEDINGHEVANAIKQLQERQEKLDTVTTLVKTALDIQDVDQLPMYCQLQFRSFLCQHELIRDDTIRHQFDYYAARTTDKNYEKSLNKYVETLKDEYHREVHIEKAITQL